MSYILDALKRADAERERGAVPGLHTQQVPALMPPVDPSPQRRFWPMLAVILALGAIALGLWVWQASRGDTRTAVVSTAATPAASAASAAAQEVLPALMPKPVPPVAPAAPAVAMQALAKPPNAPVAKPAEPVTVAPAAPVPVQFTRVPVVVPLLSELSEDLRRQIPTLTITGAVDSEYPAQRMLLVNGQVLRQGSLVAPDLSLEEIRAHSSSFSFRGTKFRIAY